MSGEPSIAPELADGRVERTAALHEVAAVLFSLLVVTVLSVPQLHFGLSLSDEGFLWYGAQRTLAGEVPLREFQAYEPGRYYWTALWMWLARDDGIVVMRCAAMLLESIAVAIVASAVWRERRSAAFAVLVSAGCILPMYVWQGRVEPSIALVQIVALGWLLRDPRELRFFVNGALLGIAALFGRNLALYGFVGLGAGVALLACVRRDSLTSPKFAWLTAGAAAGAVPFLSMLLWIPGYAAVVWDSVVRMFEIGATNIALPIPWPWRLRYPASPWSALAVFAYGGFFLIFPLFGAAAIGLTVRYRTLLSRSPLFVAAAIFSLPYAHYAFSRADLEHLARSGAALFLALALIPVGERAAWRVVPPALLAVVLALIFPQPTLSPSHWREQRGACVETIVGDDRLCVSPYESRIVEGARALVAKHVQPGESVLIAPYDPGLYSALGLVAPHWDIFPVLPLDERRERNDVDRLERGRTHLAIISNGFIDSRPELRYAVTHPLTTRYLLSRFEALQSHPLPRPYIVLIRR